MKCYRCGCKLSEHDFCTNCNADVKLYKKIIRTSNYFYNQGLEKAKVSDISGAILSLRESLKFNRHNIRARNLLGLCYYEIGEITAALSEWVISNNMRDKKNLASEYIENLQSSPSALDSIDNAIKKYNTALEYCKQADGNGIDLAIIQLKKVVSSNPKFLRASHLLALCYIEQKRPDLAKRVLDKCHPVDVNNTRTLRYLAACDEMMGPKEDKKDKGNKNKESTEPDVISYTADNETIIMPARSYERKGSNAVLNIIIGMAVGFAVAFFLVLPARIQKEREVSQEAVKTAGTQVEAKNITINELEQKVSDQTAEISTLRDSLSKYDGTEGTLLSMENLLKAAGIYLDNPDNFLEIADYLTEVDETKWTEDTSENYKNLYYALRKTVGPDVCKAYYEDANTSYRNKEYTDAIAYLTSAVFFDETNVDALYLLAQSYYGAEKEEEAKQTYNKVIELFPGTWQASNSANTLKKLNKEQ
ncbi:MAG: tetratricopeptide repeat protein [Lachnospiraceae bacterium]|nr:tetratricopeptide repeat protein [Lachnospiraceae bacterium]